MSFGILHILCIAGTPPCRMCPHTYTCCPWPVFWCTRIHSGSYGVACLHYSIPLALGIRFPRTYSVRGFRTIFDVSGRVPKCFEARTTFWSSSLVKKAGSRNLPGSRFRANVLGYSDDLDSGVLRLPISWLITSLVRRALYCKACPFFLLASLSQHVQPQPVVTPRTNTVIMHVATVLKNKLSESILVPQLLL